MSDLAVPFPDLLAGVAAGLVGWGVGLFLIDDLMLSAVAVAAIYVVGMVALRWSE